MANGAGQGRGVVLGYLRYILGFDSLAFQEGLGDAEKRLKSSQKSIQKTADSFKGIGTKLSLAVTAPLTAFAVSSFNTASDAAELQSSFDQTFGKMSGTMTKWAEDVGNAMGRSTQEMQKAANTFGIFFNTAADPAKAAAMSQTFSKLAQDLGSFYNTDTETAIEKLRSGLSGESEPLRDFGVFLTEASVKAKAMEMGLSGVGNELTEQEKILARYQLILEATKNAQGDVERTSAGTANQVRAAKAAWEELQVTIGTKLLPVITPLIEKIGAAITWFSQLPAPVQNTTLVVAGLSAALGPLALGVGGLISGFGAMLPLLVKIGPAFATMSTVITGTVIPVLATVARSLIGLAVAGGPLTLIVAAVGAVYLAWRNWDKIGPIVQAVYTAVKTWMIDKLSGAWETVKSGIQSVADKFKWMWDVVVGHSYVPDMVDAIGVEFGRLPNIMVDPAEDAANATASAFDGMASQIGNSLQSIAGNIKSGNWLGALGGLAGAIGQITGDKAFSSIGSVISGFRANGGPVSGGKSYIVGERGPEMFTPSRSGYVHANSTNDNASRSVSFDLRGAVMTEELLAQMNELANGAAQRGAMGGHAMTMDRLRRSGSRRLA